MSVRKRRGVGDKNCRRTGEGRRGGEDGRTDRQELPADALSLSVPGALGSQRMRQGKRGLGVRRLRALGAAGEEIWFLSLSLPFPAPHCPPPPPLP